MPKDDALISAINEEIRRIQNQLFFCEAQLVNLKASEALRLDRSKWIHALELRMQQLESVKAGSAQMRCKLQQLAVTEAGRGDELLQRHDLDYGLGW